MLVTQTNQPYNLKNVLGYTPESRVKSIRVVIVRTVFLSGKFAIKATNYFCRNNCLLSFYYIRGAKSVNT